MSETNSTITTADKLRSVAELLDQHTDLPAPCVFAYSHGVVEVTWQLMTAAPDDQRAVAQRIVRALGGQWAKKPWGDRYDFNQVRDDGIRLEIYADREQICERVVTGTETVTLPAVEAQPERVETRELVEWRCHPVLADEAVSA